MGVLADKTPKCHCELAGEGIKHTLACAKNFYCWVSLKGKKGKENFRSVVRESMSTGRQSVNNKKDKTVLKASKTIYICILHGLER